MKDLAKLCLSRLSIEDFHSFNASSSIMLSGQLHHPDIIFIIITLFPPKKISEF